MIFLSMMQNQIVILHVHSLGKEYLEEYINHNMEKLSMLMLMVFGIFCCKCKPSIRWSSRVELVLKLVVNHVIPLLITIKCFLFIFIKVLFFLIYYYCIKFIVCPFKRFYFLVLVFSRMVIIIATVGHVGVFLAYYFMLVR